MRRAGRIVADVLALMEEELRPGVTTAQLDAIAEDYIRKAGATPSFKGYRGFPGSICVSIDDEVVHGIPGQARDRGGPGRLGRRRRDLAGLPRRRARGRSTSASRRRTWPGSSTRRAWP